MYWFIYYGTTIIVVLYLLLDITWRLWKRKYSFLPSSPNVPWLGFLPYIFKMDSHDLHKRRVKSYTRYNHLFVSWNMSEPVIQIGRVEYVEPLLKSQEHVFKPYGYKVLGDWLGEGLLISMGAKWKKRRQSLTGAFHFTILNNFVEIFEKHAKRLLKKLETLASDGKVIEVQQLFSMSTLDVICETSMGVEIDASNSTNSDYLDAVGNIKKLVIKKIMHPFGMTKLYKYTANGKKYYKCLDTLHSFTNNVIEKNIALRKKLNSENTTKDDGNELNEDEGSHIRKKKVFIDILLDLYENQEIDIQGIHEEVDSFMFGGHDTTSSSISWILYEIGRHPEVQKKIQEEIDDVTSKDLPLVDKLRMLKYTECAIKESIRLRCPVPNFSRKLQKDMVIGENVIPSGTVMAVDLFSLHLNPEYWEDPTKFDPSRFEGNVKRNPYCFVPFSAGPRNCIGQKFSLLEKKVFLFYILSNFNVTSLQSPDELRIACNIVTHSLNGINIKFSNRNS